MKAINLFLIVVTIFMLAGSLVAAAQKASQGQTVEHEGLKVGDPVPDFLIEHIDNYNTSSAKFSDFKGKLVILDFWAIWCAPCVAAFPKMDSLQTEFGDRLQVLLINASSHNKLDSQLTVGRKTGRMDRKLQTRSIVFEKLLSVTGDKHFHQLFPHKAKPHYVWIDENQKVIAFTNGFEITKSNIRKHLSKQNLVLDQKSDWINFDHKSNYLPQFLEKDKNYVKMYSSIMKYTPDLAGGSTWFYPDSSKNVVRIKHANLPILAMFGMAYSTFSQGNPFKSAIWDYGKRVQLITTDSSKYLFEKSRYHSEMEWAMENVFTYEAVLPLVDFSTLASYWIRDIERYFQVESFVEKQSRKFYAIVRTSQADKISFKGDVSKLTSVINYDEDETMNIVGGTMETLRSKISRANISKEHLFIDRSNFQGRLQMSLKSPLDNLALLKKELNDKYDLDLVEVELPVDILVIKDK